MTAIAVLANSSLTSCSLASFSGAVLGSAAYANYRPAASRSALYVSGRHTGYKTMGGFIRRLHRILFSRIVKFLDFSDNGIMITPKFDYVV